MSNSRPIHELRFGSVRAAIWENQSGENTFHNVSFQRTYRDGNEWKQSDSYRGDDLLNLAKAADHAHTWITEQRSSRRDRR